ncbi:hypothetical protein P170DRAFT_452432 [Aspergillus steynii IBT 23096]|uniref:Zn(2)-C6 fungal-type domain-containing protein n=1 Tax=Aspergillus steynii IBT 23096 TaxID=1392250 RepID=A0A2I2GPH6_9EURO|nr:uncharacterized protein P170DRAFT_452432 [Aspergillus steynii IBT 23096]PLB54779.1 hypothetical protein P170DRAFT_452432 [Aspergillus steynii IBT 23096]
MTPTPAAPEPSSNTTANANRPGQPRKRTRTGCLNCSRRRRKCDEAKPTCTGCKRRGEKCQWRMLGSFRDANLKVLGPEHPSMNQGAGGRGGRQSKFKILNVVPSASSSASRRRKHDVSGSASGSGQFHIDKREVNANASTTGISYHPPQSFNPHSPSDTIQLDDTSTTNQPYLHSSPEYVVDELGALQALPHNPGPSFTSASAPEPYQTIASPLFDHSVFSDPANFTNDVFLPGSAYEALHTALRNRQLWTARSDIPSRRSSPEVLGRGFRGMTPSANEMVDRDVRSGPGPGRYFELSSERENVLWQNYLNEICLWLDMFDNHRHFASTFPQMAKSAPHLRYSILALSARQIERKQNEKSQSESLSLYQEAIHLLLPELESKSTPVIASCVILCVLEMLSCNPKEWRRHLDGCAYLIQAAEINGFSGKEEQALFWCFARMDVCGGLISEEETIIPMTHWIPKTMDPREASALFLSSSDVCTFDTYANYTVYLCAQTLGVLFGASTAPQLPVSASPSCVSCQYLGSPRDEGESYLVRWKRLFDCVEEWYAKRPCQMKSIFSVAAGGQGWRRERGGERERPFPTVLYGNGSAISGNQLYHVCALLLLQRKPKTLALARRPKSPLWHARQICAISASNTHHGCWTNALQPLWVAGKAMSHYSEHAAIVDTLTRIERETGWATAWRVEDLKDFWGDDEVDGDWEGEVERGMKGST